MKVIFLVRTSRNKVLPSCYLPSVFTSTSPLFLPFHSAPCAPSSFLSNVNCGTGVVSVTWNNSVAGVMYTVSAADAKGARHNCSSTNSGCNLSTLACGTQYNVTITPSRNECVGKGSQTKMVKTGKYQLFFSF